jgi:DNA-directed RNA polymerase subunit beta'
MQRYRNVRLSYRGHSIESETGTTEGPLPDWAPDELKEIEALLPVRPEPGALSEADLESAFDGFEFDDAGDIDISAFENMTFDPNAEVMLGGFDEDVELEEIDAEPAEAAPISDDLETVTLADIGVSARWVNKFTEAGVVCVADLKGQSDDDLLGLAGIGQKAVEEVRAGLEKHGIQIMV